MEALARANRLRGEQAQLRHEVATGETALADALVDPRVCTHTTVVYLLSWQRRWGTMRARRACSRVAIGESKTVNTLTDRQRHVLLDSLAGVEQPLTPVGASV